MHAGNPEPDGISDDHRYRSRRSILATAVGTALVGLAGCSSASPPPSTGTPSNRSNIERGDYEGDVFTGTLTTGVGSDEPATAATGFYEGTIVYDRSCQGVGDGLTGCDAGIETSELGTVNFYYEHDMERKPCLSPDQQVVLDVGQAQATVQRRVDESE